MNKQEITTIRCIKCGIELAKHAKYCNTLLCRKCYVGEPKVSFCILCNKKLSRAGYYIKSTYCKSCSQTIKNTGKKLSQETKNKIGKANTNKLSGIKNHKYKDGHTLYQHYCSCGNPIHYNSKICKKCHYIKHSELMKKLYKKGIILSERKYGKNHPRFGKIAEHGKGSMYRNTYMRSTWEIKYAQYLDSNNIKWLYESKTFDLGNTTYTPDFYLPETDEYIEIKG